MTLFKSNTSESELAVLKVLWELGAANVRTVMEALPRGKRKWAYTTVQTMLGRMVEKGYVTVDRNGFAHVFGPAISRDSLVGLQLQELREKLCDGAATPLLLQLAEGRNFTPAEIARNVHAHPTLSEVLGEAAEAAEGHAIHG